MRHFIELPLYLYVQRTTGCLPTDGRRTQRQSTPQEKYVFPEPPSLGQGLNRAIDRGRSMQGLGSNPYSGRMTRGDARQVEGRDGKAGSSSTSRLSQTTKRRKLEHLQGDVSKYFSNENSVRRGSRAIPSTSTSSRPSSTIVAASVDPIIIDAEDDAPATDDDSHEPIVLRTPSPDQLDVISPNTVSYSFDQNKPSPMDAFSSSLEEKRKSPQDGESTLRVRNVVKKSEMRTTESVSRPDSDGDDVLRLSKTLPVLLSRNATAQAEASSGGGYVKRRVAYFDGIEGKNKNASGPRYINLEQLSQSRKNGMKPKQVGPSSVMRTTVPATE